MTHLGKKTALAFVAIVLLGACATNPRASLPKVESHLASRTDAKVAWPVSDEERAGTDAAVRELLAGELTIESAVQIALLNSRSLRATFEGLELSQADLVEAGRLANPSLSALVRWPKDSPRVPHTEFRLSTEVLNAVFLPVRKRLAQEQIAQAEQRVTHEVLGLVAEVKAAALSHLAERQFHERLGVIAQVNETTADLAQRQYDAGNINRLELLQLQTATEQTTLDITRADASLRAGRAPQSPPRFEGRTDKMGIRRRPARTSDGGAVVRRHRGRRHRATPRSRSGAGAGQRGRNRAQPHASHAFSSGRDLGGRRDRKGKRWRTADRPVVRFRVADLRSGPGRVDARRIAVAAGARPLRGARNRSRHRSAGRMRRS